MTQFYPEAASSISPGSPERFFNRELSWLEFNARVLEEANNPNNPLLERLNFLAISDSNLDEFYMVRVAGLKGQKAARVNYVSPDGRTGSQQLAAINQRAKALVEEQSRTWRNLAKVLAKEGIGIVKPHQLTVDERDWLKQKFTQRLFSSLTPLAVDPAHPFPLISNDGLCIVLKLMKKSDQRPLWAIIPLPGNLDRFIAVMDQPGRFIALEDVVMLFIHRLMPGFMVDSHGLFHLIRDSEMDIDEDVEDLIEMFKSALKQRRRGHVIRLMVNEDIPEELLEFVKIELDVNDDDVFRVQGMLNLGDITELILPERPDLMYKPFSPKVPGWLAYHGGNIFEAIRQQDRLVHHPYESFNVVIDFLEQAARDPNVLAIKQTVYRTSKDSPVVRALIEAAEAGKSVTAVVELKARFDEEDNIRLAEKLERAGVHVVYGFIDHKTHCKLSLVVRQEGKNVRNYVHVGTGNYHPITAKIYTDLSLFTASEALCRDVAKVFNFLTGYALPERLSKLVISPSSMQHEILQLIEDEITHAKEGRGGFIWAKMNALVDPAVIDALYRASQAGVQIDLVIRGICCLRPGLPGLSENIRVKSIVGRFLEHARIIAFGNGQPIASPQTLVFISSADWMPRNFHSRVETMIPLEDPDVMKQVLDQIMATNLNDRRQSWTLMPNGHYQRETLDRQALNAHEYFMTNPSLMDLQPARPSGAFVKRRSPRLKLAKRKH